MTGVSEYEKLRLANIENNKKMLESLGLLNSFKPILNPITTKKPIMKKKEPVKRKFVQVFPESTENPDDSFQQPKRRSLRVKGIQPDGSIYKYIDDDIEDDVGKYKPKKKYVKKENHFGPIEDVPVGTHWWTRMECSSDGVHRPTVAGIHGNESIGCYSIALSGGYEDDIDLGESFTYTGSGGRDLKGTPNNPKNLRTAPQSKDQTLTKMNLALSLNVENRQPVRVIRGYKLQSPFAPEYGYRYDGLYTVEKFWCCPGLSNFLVYKFILKRMKDQDPPPWTEDLKEENKNNNKIESNNNEKNGDIEKQSGDNDDDSVNNQYNGDDNYVGDNEDEAGDNDQLKDQVDENEQLKDQVDHNEQLVDNVEQLKDQVEHVEQLKDEKLDEVISLHTEESTKLQEIEKTSKHIAKEE